MKRIMTILGLLSNTMLFTWESCAKDWLVDPAPFKAAMALDQASGDVVLDNGLVRRVIRTRNGCATIAYDIRNRLEELLLLEGSRGRGL